MGAIRDRLNSIAKNERLFSLNELYDKESSLSWNEYFSEIIWQCQLMKDEEFALYVGRGNVEVAELLLKDMDSFRKIRDGIISDYIKLSKSRAEDI